MTDSLPLQEIAHEFGCDCPTFSKAQIYTLTLLAVEPPAVDSLQVESKDQAESPAEKDLGSWYVMNGFSLSSSISTPIYPICLRSRTCIKQGWTNPKIALRFPNSSIMTVASNPEADDHGSSLQHASIATLLNCSNFGLHQFISPQYPAFQSPNNPSNSW